MRYRTFGKTGIKVSVVSFGCNQVGSPVWGYRSFEKAKEAVLSAIEHGINHFDTADVYGGRNSEEWLGKILSGRRKDVVISTKAGLTGDGGRNGRPEHLRASLQNSLKKLGTDYTDVFYLHRPDPDVPLAESLGAVDELVKEGKARFGGVSQLEVRDLAVVSEENSVACAQYCLNYYDFKTAYSAMPETARRGYGFCTYSPFKSGIITRDMPMKPFKRGFPFLSADFFRPEFPLYKTVRAVAGRLDLSMHELALGWILSHELVHTVIVGASSWLQFAESIRAADTALSDETIREIGSAVERDDAERHYVRRKIWVAAKTAIGFVRR
jgi:aryl-alcohol dehydrogenase-like predicted oxidoreductase